MQLTTVLTAALASAASVFARPSLEQRAKTPEVIGPFALKISAPGPTYNGKYIVGSHIGAAIDLAVPSSAPAKVFYINATDGGYTDKGITYGRLMYNIDFPRVPYMGGLAVNTSSNIAALLLSVEPPEYTFSLNAQGQLLLGGESRWYGCYGDSYGQQVPSINWEFGTSGPTQKECQRLTLTKA